MSFSTGFFSARPEPDPTREMPRYRFNEDLISLVSEAPVVATTAVVLWPVFSDKKMY